MSPREEVIPPPDCSIEIVPEFVALRVKTVTTLFSGSPACGVHTCQASPHSTVSQFLKINLDR